MPMLSTEIKTLLPHITGNKSGVGKFGFTPELNQSYKALVTLSGNKYVFSLPITEPKGYVLNFNSDSSVIYIKNNQNNYKSKHYLLVAVRGAVFTSIEAKLDTKTLKIHLPLEIYPKGIVQITCLTAYFVRLLSDLYLITGPIRKC